MTIPSVTLNNGVAMPQVGFGVFQVPNDDTEAAVMRRLELYHTATEPILDFYRGLGRLVEIDGIGTGDEVFGRVSTAVDARIG